MNSIIIKKPPIFFYIDRYNDKDDKTSPIRTAVHPRSPNTWLMTIVAAALPAK